MNKRIGLLIIVITLMLIGAGRKIYAGPNDLEAVLKNADGTSAFEVQDNAQKTLVRMQSDGKVGIGTTTPSLILDVVGSSTVSGNLAIGTSQVGSRLTIKGSGATSATSALSIQNSAGTSMLFVNDAGNVGIGTTNPAVDLDIVGTVTISSGLNIGTTTSAITMHLSGSGLITFGTISTNACSDKFFSLVGASDGDTVSIGVPAAMVGTSSPGLIYFGYISENNSVAIRACNFTGGTITPSSGIVTVDIWKH